MGGVREKLAYLRGLIRGADFYGSDEKAQEDLGKHAGCF